MSIPLHYRKDSPNGITPPNPDNVVTLVEHITKCRGLKTHLTSVSAREESIRHFGGELYSTSPEEVIANSHRFVAHTAVREELRLLIQASKRAERVLAQRALQYAEKAHEAVISWEFDFSHVDRKDRINWCGSQIQPFFRRA
ncbi:hypothetical protein KBB96_07015 [Luteolibacter ambystomatis]|uniref:Uncharacterized protein n=1 Tax=Luteolibacter ambystomatis TaxID=2824561 RepID=A0A975J249_9BACT|nr:hypothetical protein [Luteolibacter ambystomatis]QUE52638.1 hypothetical protein KBB96_07015 [Luteolibacter ambystomatis]